MSGLAYRYGRALSIESDVTRHPRRWPARLAALAHAAGVECDNLPARLRLRGFGQLFGNAEQALAPIHLFPNVLGIHPGRAPEHDEMIEQVGALADHRVAFAVH